MNLFKREVTGIDIGTKTIKIICSKGDTKKTVVQKALTIELPDDYNLENHLDIAFHLISQTKKEHKISLNNVAILCPKFFYDSFTVKLPNMKVKDLKSAINWEFKNRFNINPENYNIDYYPNNTLEGNQIEYLIYFAEKSKIDEIVLKAKNYGINIRYIDIDIIANIICYNASYYSDNTIKALLDIGYNSGRITFLQNEKILFNRELEFGLKGLYNLFSSDNFNNLKFKGLKEERIEKISSTYLSELMFDITKSIDYFVNALKYPQPTSILCNGGLFSIPGMFEHFQKNIPYTMILNNVLEITNYSGELKKFGYLFNLALGLALQ